MNLDDFYKDAGVDESKFLPAMAAFAKRDGHWYGMPAASNPTQGDLLFVPKQVEAAGLDPDNPPRTWDELYDASKKVVKFDSKGNLERVGYQLIYDQGQLADPVNLYCGRWATYDPSTSKFSANAPCIKDFFRLQKKFADLYGGIQKYQKFYAGDPQVWSCSPKEYLTTGKVMFRVDAWWSGNQMDQCPNYKQEWRLSRAPTLTGSDDELKGVRTTAWMVAIPKGAKHPQLAFDFAKLVLWDNARKLGPTTNGAVVTDQLGDWASTLIKASNASRAKHGAEGRPMAGALKTVLSEAKVGEVARSTDPNTAYYDELLNKAWEDIAFGRKSVDDALDEAQEQIDRRQGS
jgi:ABC-type glycerol-3-phosphate transport system substrate-binding protein